MALRRRAFTLIELLVVIAIIALLLAILLPALGRVRRQGRTVVCQAREHEWGLAFSTMAQQNEGYLADPRIIPSGGADLNPTSRCRTQQFAYYIDNWHDFADLLYCPNATGRAGTSGIGSALKAWFCPVHPFRSGSYGVNGNGPGYSRWDRNVGAASVSWDTVYQKHGSNIPVMADGAVWASFGQDTDRPPATAETTTTSGFNPQGLGYFCINRHDGNINVLFMDWSVRKVGLKQLWTLKWHSKFNTAGAWTKLGGVQPASWPQWMRMFSDD